MIPGPPSNTSKIASREDVAIWPIHASQRASGPLAKWINFDRRLTGIGGCPCFARWLQISGTSGQNIVTQLPAPDFPDQPGQTKRDGDK